MDLDPTACYTALGARDRRFDGVFFVGVRTTGVYCRPVCPARTPGSDRCAFYRCAAEAERDGFRPCLRCRPELAPGNAPIDALARLVSAAVARIDAGDANERRLADVARDLGVSGRHLRRAVVGALGISPVDLAQSRRIALARQLLRDTGLRVTDIAFASGFSSIRRFNAAFRARCGHPPSEVRRRAPGREPRPDAFAVRLEYRPPLDWPALLGFLRARATPGVEAVHGDAYARTVALAGRRGWVSVAPAPGGCGALRAEISVSLAPVVMPLVARLRRLFDLDAHPDAIAAHLARDPRLRALVRARPGLRVPGALDGFETTVRGILGQQVSVAAATTLAGRIAAALGEPVETPFPDLVRLAPAPAGVAGAGVDALRACGVVRARAETIRALAEAVASGGLVLEPQPDVERAIAGLRRLRGIGDWTAQYVAMRVLRWPDAFLAGDLGIRKALRGLTEARARERAERWRPWRAYAAMHLWASLA